MVGGMADFLGVGFGISKAVGGLWTFRSTARDSERAGSLFTVLILRGANPSSFW